jgi:hypothetical protein
VKSFVSIACFCRDLSGSIGELPLIRCMPDSLEPSFSRSRKIMYFASIAGMSFNELFDTVMV